MKVTFTSLNHGATWVIKVDGRVVGEINRNGVNPKDRGYLLRLDDYVWLHNKPKKLPQMEGLYRPFLAFDDVKTAKRFITATLERYYVVQQSDNEAPTQGPAAYPVY